MPMFTANQTTIPSRVLAEAQVLFCRADGSLDDECIVAFQRVFDSVMELWKYEQGNRIPQGGGLLGLCGMSFDDAKPWQCVENEPWHDATSLLIKLWNDKYVPLEKLNIPERMFLAALILRKDRSWGDAYNRFRELTDTEERAFQEIGSKILRAMTPLAEYGRSFKNAQKSKAQKSRGKVTEDGGTIKEIVERLALSSGLMSAKELWTEFWAKLDELGLDPEEHDDGVSSGDIRKSKYTYYFQGGGRKSITFGRFATIVSSCRANDAFKELRAELWGENPYMRTGRE